MRELALYLSEPRGAFDWASANCCHFAAGWVKRMTGRDPMAGLPATAGAHQARRLVRALGGDLKAAWTRQLGIEPAPADQAQPGDVVLALMNEGGAAVGVCAGLMAIFIDAEGSTLAVPLSSCACAWRLS
jgi:hypothetical protein